jgi:very-short-patch-repair endonuclease
MTTPSRSRTLRQAAPATERTLWRALRGRRLGGLKFRRQVPLGPYVVDFLCLRHRLIIEADGPFHDVEDDARRDAWLQAQGFHVLRFTNREVNNLDHVRGRILAAVEAPPEIDV